MNDSGKGNKSKRLKALQRKNVLEQLGEIGTQAGQTIASEAQKTGQDILRQLLNQQQKVDRVSGNIEPGQSLVFKEKPKNFETDEMVRKQQDQLMFERRLFSEIQQVSERKLGELRFKLKVLAEEALKVAASAGSLGQETKTALMQNIVVPSEYQINFLQSIIDNLVKFRKTIDSAVNWMQESNKRRQKKNYWSMYKKKGSSFLLSGESYSQRSAG